MKRNQQQHHHKKSVRLYKVAFSHEGDPITALEIHPNHGLVIGTARGAVSLWSLEAMPSWSRTKKEATSTSTPMKEDGEDGDQSRSHSPLIIDNIAELGLNRSNISSSSIGSDIFLDDDNNIKKGGEENKEDEDEDEDDEEAATSKPLLLQQQQQQPENEKDDDEEDESFHRQTATSHSSHCLRRMALQNEEAITDIGMDDEHIWAIVGDLGVWRWSSSEEKRRRKKNEEENSNDNNNDDDDGNNHDGEFIKFARVHNQTVCTLSFPVKNESSIHVLMQGQPKKSHLLDLQTMKQRELPGFGLPWHTIPTHFDRRHKRILLRQDFKAKGNTFFSGKYGGVQKLMVWDLRSLESPIHLQTIDVVGGTGGYKLWNDKVAVFQNEVVSLFSIASGQKVDSLQQQQEDGQKRSSSSCLVSNSSSNNNSGRQVNNNSDSSSSSSSSTSIHSSPKRSSFLFSRKWREDAGEALPTSPSSSSSSIKYRPVAVSRAIVSTSDRSRTTPASLYTDYPYFSSSSLFPGNGKMLKCIDTLDDLCLTLSLHNLLCLWSKTGQIIRKVALPSLCPSHFSRDFTMIKLEKVQTSTTSSSSPSAAKLSSSASSSSSLLPKSSSSSSMTLLEAEGGGERDKEVLFGGLAVVRAYVSMGDTVYALELL